MGLEELFETDLSVRKTVWSKRGDAITRHNVDRLAATEMPNRNVIEIAKPDESDEKEDDDEG